MPVKVANTFRPVSPIGEATSNLINAFVAHAPTPIEAAKTAQIQQQLGAPGELEQLFTRAYSRGGPPVVTNPHVSQEDIANAYPPQPQRSREDLVRDELPKLAGTLGRAGEYSQIGNLIRTLVANAPDLKDTQMIDRSMLGAGQSYNSTIGGFREEEANKTARANMVAERQAGSLGTAALRTRAAKVNDAQRLYGLPPAEATALVDGVIAIVQDSGTGNTFLVNKATGTRKLLNSPSMGAEPTANAVFNAPSDGLAGNETDLENLPPPGEGAVDFLTELTDPASGQGGLNSPQGGPVTLSDDTGAVTDGPATGAPASPAGAPVRVTPNDIKLNVGKAVGAIPTAKRLYNSTIGQVIPGTTMTGAENSQQDIKLLKQKALNAFAISGRPPVMEQERIASLFPATDDQGYIDSAMQNPEVARNKLAALAEFGMMQHAADQKALLDPNLPRQDRVDLSRRVREMDDMVKMLVTPEIYGQFKTGKKAAPKTAPRAAPPGQPAAVSPEGGLPSPKSAQERDMLPPGTKYLAPDGTIKVRQ